MSSDTLQSFIAANAAYTAMPFDGRNRMQLALSLESLVITDKRVRLAPEAADRVAKIAASVAPSHPGALVARAQYLFNSGRWKDGNEIERIEQTLRSKAKTYPQTWMIVAYHAHKRGDVSGAVDALVAGLEAGGDMKDMRRIAESMNLEIEEK